jgi:MFS family permease
VLVGQALIAFAVFVVDAALIAVLLPSRVAALDPIDKVPALAAVLTAGSVVTAIAQPVIGALSDRTSTPVGRRLPWMIGGALLGGAAIGVLAGAPSVLVLALAWAVAQPAISAVQVSSDAFLVDAFPAHQRGRAAGIVGIAVVIGSGAGAVLAGSRAGETGQAFWILVALLPLAVIAFALIVRDTRRPLADRPRRHPLIVLREIATHADYLRVLLWRFGYSIAYGSVFAYLLYLLTDLVGVTKDQAGPLVGLATLLGGGAALLSVLLGGWLSDRLGRRRLFLLIGNGALIAGAAALLISHTVAAALVTATLFGVGLGLSLSCGRALASLLLPDQVGGAAGGLGILNTVANVGQAIAPAIGALAIGWAGYPGALMASIAGAVVCSIAIATIRSVR